MLRKRCHSFEDDLSPQLKTHVGEKEINSGVNKDQNMKAVYAKTLDMLFKASPKKMGKESTVIAMQNVNESTGRYKQMFLDSNCKLQFHGNIKESQLNCVCEFCSVPCSLQKCTFCERSLCETCKYACRRCEKYFCTSCIFSVFEGNDEFTICQSCY